MARSMMYAGMHLWDAEISVKHVGPAITIQFGANAEVELYPTGSNLTVAELAKVLIDGLMPIAQPAIKAQVDSVAVGAIE